MTRRLPIVPTLFVAAARANAEFLQFFFVHEHFQRFLTTEHQRTGEQGHERMHDAPAGHRQLGAQQQRHDHGRRHGVQRDVGADADDHHIGWQDQGPIG